MAGSGATKRDRRSTLRARRRSLADRRDLAADDQALADITHGLIESLGLRAGDTVTLYESLPVEPPTGATTDVLLAAGMRVIVPITLADLDLDWADVEDPSRAPLGKEAIGSARLALIPGLAVDHTGTRMGQGGGCYDRALPRRARGTPVVVLLHPEEFAPEPLPREDHDIPVDGVLTAEALTWIER